ncbi:hypothetical protein RD792_002339 [Penstemon davidsonii]|uniref:DOG1 domain-containing protein n=1 Tax=Penstemon davidsonii TaxID=160366 RepID=A0ABR0DRG4_9LAMI|nr:hypothetical protein RD792_002339 [Penstemon davidsonii]
MRTQVEQNFSNFYDKWMRQLEDLLQLLLVVSKEHTDQEAGYEAVVDRLTAHHKEFYKFKWAAAHEDVLSVFTPVWLSPLENAYLWVTGWKPSMAFRLVESLRGAQTPATGSLAGMTEEQVKKMEALRAKMKVEEERVEREMERQQVAMADRKLVELARLERRAKTSEGGSAAAVAQVDGLVEVALKGLLVGLERVMKMADCARLKTLKGVLDVLTPMQSVDFLAAKSMLQIQMRKWGKMRETNSDLI